MYYSASQIKAFRKCEAMAVAEILFEESLELSDLIVSDLAHYFELERWVSESRSENSCDFQSTPST